MKIDRDCLENYWYYYKYHTFAAIFIIAVILITVFDIASKVKPDINISAIGSFYISEQSTLKIKDELSKKINDINNDNKKEIIIQNIYINSLEKPNEQSMALMQKVQLELSVSDTKLFIMDKAFADIYANENYMQKLNSLADEAGVKYGGDIYKLPVSEKFLKENNINSSDLYLCLKLIPQKEQKKEIVKKEFQNAYLIIKEMIK